ncbi:MAG: hypothetical protein GXY87_03155 [Tissierellia bacterium]|nr:hypothetical protein [Tissierellia bacterium]
MKIYSKDELIYTPKELRDEYKKIFNEYLENDEYEDVDFEIVLHEKASKELLNWIQQAKEFSEKNLKKGIIIN